MIIEKLDENNATNCQFIEDLYINAFPTNERRPINAMYALYADCSPFNISTIKINNSIVGFITYWDFDFFIYAEHFSISSEFRNEGFGKQAIELFTSTINKALILEVETPTDDLTKRRISFYKRAGFKLWDNIEYAQPPYIAGKDYIPMCLMTIGDLNLEDKLAEVKKIIFKYVYNIENN